MSITNFRFSVTTRSWKNGEVWFHLKCFPNKKLSVIPTLRSIQQPEHLPPAQRQNVESEVWSQTLKPLFNMFLSQTVCCAAVVHWSAGCCGLSVLTNTMWRQMDWRLIRTAEMCMFQFHVTDLCAVFLDFLEVDLTKHAKKFKGQKVKRNFCP